MSEVLPAEVVALIGPVPYLSTACQTEAALEACSDPRLPGVLAELDLPTVDVLVAVFHARCRRTHKFTGTGCSCWRGHKKEAS